MSTENSNITFAALSGVTFHVTNSADTASTYNIEADVQLIGSEVAAINNGSLTSRSAGNNGSVQFWANSSSTYYELSTGASADHVAIITAIQSFLDSVKTTAPAKVASIAL